MNGVLVLDKPTGLSSATAVDHVKRTLRAARAGHGGTLDPIATGVLSVCLGAATKLAQFLLADDKAYIADGILGVETDTLDRGGRIVAQHPVDVREDALRAAIARHLGEQDQVPPMYSALKQGGVRLYDLARAGEDVERAPRRIRVDRFELLAFEPPRFRVAIACSKGTYVRSLVADLGSALGCGAHLAELRRTRSGRFTIEQAVRFEDLATLDLATALVPLTEAIALPRATVPPHLLRQVLSGLQLPFETWDFGGEKTCGTPMTSVSPMTPDIAKAPRFQLVDERGRLVAIVHAEDGRTCYDRVFPELVTA